MIRWFCRSDELSFSREKRPGIRAFWNRSRHSERDVSFSFAGNPTVVAEGPDLVERILIGHDTRQRADDALTTGGGGAPISRDSTVRGAGRGGLRAGATGRATIGGRDACARTNGVPGIAGRTRGARTGLERRLPAAAQDRRGDDRDQSAHGTPPAPNMRTLASRGKMRLIDRPLPWVGARPPGYSSRMNLRGLSATPFTRTS